MDGRDTDLPHYGYAFTPDGQVSAQMDTAFVSQGIAGYLDDTPIWLAFRATLPPGLADLMDVARAVYLADRLSPRRSQTDIACWARRIEITVPVRDPDRWNDPVLIAALGALLWDFTEDEWLFHFVPRDGALRRTEIQPALFPTPPAEPTRVALFSGGLDSLAGACRDRLAQPTGSMVLVSAVTNPRLANVQRQSASGLRRRLGDGVIPVSVPLGFHRNGRSYDDDESSQRSRGFLFLALGAAAALMAGAENLAVYENGVGAINLPYTGAERGAQHTRAAAPHLLVAMSAFIARATGQTFAIRLPFLFTTKGEMCTSLRELGIETLVGCSVSCDGFPLRLAGTAQCGTCTSCLLRRQALHAAGLAATDRLTRYWRDITQPEVALSREQRYPLQLMRAQVETLGQALAENDPWRALVRAYPVLVDAVRAAPDLGHATAGREAGLVALYRCYCDEWHDFLAGEPRQSGTLAA
ncbi:MAG: 7-cyano-7-deazaguanine synthase [Chloroflexota bacterium]|nr:7-cyano-7-deazaguanine synthase [Chloroflexota bacterium]